MLIAVVFILIVVDAISATFFLVFDGSNFTIVYLKSAINYCQIIACYSTRNLT